MQIISSLHEWRIIRQSLSQQTIGFVPTMGHLHQGHVSLCRQSLAENKITVASIFVNPTQFNQPSDFQLYPRTLDADSELLQSEKIDYLFVPEADEMYADKYEMQVIETNLSQQLEGQYRPGHFNGMLTVVLKLLNLVQARRAYFGEKDYQQLLLVKKMAQAFFLSTEIIACKTIRAEDHLALSSRNSRLTSAERQHATHFPRLLQRTDLSVEKITAELQALGFKVDYIVEQWGRRLGAVWLGDIRLIDAMDVE